MADVDRHAARDTIASALRGIAGQLAEAGVPEPMAEARRILRVVGFAAAEIIAAPDRALDEPARCLIRDITRRRAAREPLTRIAGEREFFGRVFHISPATLDPRPDTEVLVESALEAVRSEGWEDAPIRILDVGTGSGCLLITLLAELPHASGLGTDISPEALAVAGRNAGRHGAGPRARFELRRSLSGVERAFDVLVANPPYIATGDIETLAPEVRRHDPRLALDGGADGLDIYREIARDLERTVPKGWALFEVGAGQSEAVRRMLCGCVNEAAKWRVRTWPDLGGHTRCVGVRTG